MASQCHGNTKYLQPIFFQLICELKFLCCFSYRSRFQHTSFAIILYCLPSVIAHGLFYCQFSRQRDCPLSLGLRTQARLIGTNIFWSIVSIGLTAAGYRTGYTFTVLLMISLTTTVLIGVFRAQNTSKSFYLSKI